MYLCLPDIRLGYSCAADLITIMPDPDWSQLMKRWHCAATGAAGVLALGPWAYQSATIVEMTAIFQGKLMVHCTGTYGFISCTYVVLHTSRTTANVAKTLGDYRPAKIVPSQFVLKQVYYLFELQHTVLTAFIF